MQHIVLWAWRALCSELPAHRLPLSLAEDLARQELLGMGLAGVQLFYLSLHQ